MKITYTLIYIVLIALLALPVGAVDVAQLVKNHPLQANYPGDESVVLYEGIQYILHSDGRITKTVHLVRTLFNENSLDHYGDAFIDYYDAKQTLEVEICRAYMLEGKAVDTWKNGLNQITPFALDKAPDFLGFQEMVCTHTGLEWGGTTELKYTVSDKEKISDWLEGIEYFQTDEYIKHKVVSIAVPENVELNFTFLNGDGNVKQEVKDGITTWTWEMKNVPHILHDDAYKYRLRFAPTLVFSTCMDWKYAGNTFAKQIKEMSNDSEVVKAAAAEAVKGLMTDMETVESIAKYVRDHIRTLHYNGDFFPWYARPAERTLQTTYGNEFNQATLLASMLKAAGFSAKLAVSGDVFEADFKVPMISLYENFWVLTEVEGKKLFIDPTTPLSGNSYKDLAGQALFKLDFNQQKPEVIEPFSAKENTVVLKLKMKIEEDGSYKGSGYFAVGGYFCPYYKIVDSGAEEWLKGQMEGLLPNLKVSSGSAMKLGCCGCEMKFDFSGENLGEADEGYLTVAAPHSPIGVEDLLPSGFNAYYKEHKNPIFLKGGGSLTINAEFELPASWQVAYQPENMDFNNAAVVCKINTVSAGNKVELKAEFALLKERFEGSEYKLLKELYSRRQNHRTHLVFKLEK